MADDAFHGLDIVPVWARFNADLIRLVDYVPDDKINWSPKPELWNFRGILLHIAAARDSWLERHREGRHRGAECLADRADEGGGPGGVRAHVGSPGGVPRAIRRSSAATYEDEPAPVTGHWIAFHLLEHDIHHRADIFHYLALLGIETPDVGTP